VSGPWGVGEDLLGFLGTGAAVSIPAAVVADDRAGAYDHVVDLSVQDVDDSGNELLQRGSGAVVVSVALRGEVGE